jgi:hypothetical protein
VGPAPQRVNGPAIEKYLQATDYYSRHPRNFEHIKQCVVEGARLLPP